MLQLLLVKWQHIGSKKTFGDLAGSAMASANSIQIGGITLKCKAGRQVEMMEADDDPMLQWSVSSGQVSNQKPEECLLDDDQPEPPASFMEQMDEKPLRCSFHSFTQYSHDDPPIGPNGFMHQQWTNVMDDLMTALQKNNHQKDFEQHILKERGTSRRCQ